MSDTARKEGKALWDVLALLPPHWGHAPELIGRASLVSVGPSLVLRGCVWWGMGDMGDSGDLVVL